MENSNSNVRRYLIRLGIVFAISLAFVIIFNEFTFLMQKDKNDRAPQTFSISIPAGTAQRIEAGEDVPSIPSEIVFVLGDTLEVINEDSVSHQLGPIWVPSGSSSKLVMDVAENLAYSCSFQTSRYLGLDVRQPTTFGTRLIAIGLAAPTMTALLYIYSLLVFPLDQNNKSTSKDPLLQES